MRTLKLAVALVLFAAVVGGITWNAVGLQVGALLGKSVEIKLKDQSIIKGTVVAETEEALLLKVIDKKEEVKVLRSEIVEVRIERGPLSTYALWIGVLIIISGLALIIWSMTKAG